MGLDLLVFQDYSKSGSSPLSEGTDRKEGGESKTVDADVQLRGSNLRFGVKKNGAAATYY
jgi:hypothetical protein